LTGTEPHAKETSHRAEAVGPTPTVYASSKPRLRPAKSPTRPQPLRSLIGATAVPASRFGRHDLPSSLEWVYLTRTPLAFQTSNPRPRYRPERQHLATCSQLLPSVVQHQRVGAKGQSMRHRSITRKCDQGRNVSFATKSRGESCPDPNPIPCPLARVFCLLNELGYTICLNKASSNA
jgi:hypothetical protein